MSACQKKRALTRLDRKLCAYWWCEWRMMQRRRPNPSHLRMEFINAYEKLFPIEIEEATDWIEKNKRNVYSITVRWWHTKNIFDISIAVMFIWFAPRWTGVCHSRYSFTYFLSQLDSFTFNCFSFQIDSVNLS